MVNMTDIPPERRPQVEFPFDLIQGFIAKMQAVNSAELDIVIIAAKVPDGGPVMCGNAGASVSAIRLMQMMHLIQHSTTVNVIQLGPEKKG